jgi:hypothetical protein
MLLLFYFRINFISATNKPIFNVGLADFFEIFDEKKWTDKVALRNLRDALARLNQVSRKIMSFNFFKFYFLDGRKHFRSLQHQLSSSRSSHQGININFFELIQNSLLLL